MGREATETEEVAKMAGQPAQPGQYSRPDEGKAGTQRDFLDSQAEKKNSRGEKNLVTYTTAYVVLERHVPLRV